jgi:hypothetical protein
MIEALVRETVSLASGEPMLANGCSIVCAWVVVLRGVHGLVSLADLRWLRERLMCGVRRRLRLHGRAQSV